MGEWQNRVVDERGKLNQKIQKLDDFIKSDKFDSIPSTDAFALMTQCFHMKAYINVLDFRINRF